MSSSFFGKRKKDRIYALFDIGSASVGAAILIIPYEGKGKIIYQTRETLPIEKELTPARLVALKGGAFSSAVHAITHAGYARLYAEGFGKPHIDEVFCFFSSPWLTSTTVTVSIEAEKPFIISPELILPMLAEKRDGFLATFGADDHNPAILIDETVIEARINGYSVERFFLRYGRKFEATVFLSAAPHFVIDRIETTIGKSFHAPISHYAFSLAAYTTIRNHLPLREDFVFIDVTGEITDVSIVRGGILLQHFSLPIGTRTLTRLIMKRMNTTAAVASTIVRMAGENKLDDRQMKTARSIIAEYAAFWSKEFEKAVELIQDTFLLPQQIFLTIDDDSADHFIALLKKEKRDISGIADARFDVIYINQKLVSSFLESGPWLSDDPFLILEGVFTGMRRGASHKPLLPTAHGSFSSSRAIINNLTYAKHTS